ncbi:hypothetical protein [Brevibacillus sp. MER 51]|uniref:hypothetical protein n=1 Tax=Brevibacillus sp. MER 51 TaxID=2939560 RepID=UPI00203A392F|nr:hypothetical protein [Brevibacillus sp. MER 51]MCM3144324.1 hypothetical protein [Brevibacillus sp. MER 51]
MSLLAPDFPTHVERTENFRKQQKDQLAFDVTNEALEMEIRTLMFELEDIQDTQAAAEIRSELESIWEFKNDYSPFDNWLAVQEQKRELKKLA